jgi:hypothetical protein
MNLPSLTSPTHIYTYVSHILLQFVCARTRTRVDLSLPPSHHLYTSVVSDDDDEFLLF